MLALFPKVADWNGYAAYSDTMAKASQWIEDKPAAAVSILEPMKPPGYLLDMRRKDLLQARALDLSGKLPRLIRTFWAAMRSILPMKFAPRLANTGRG